MAKKIPQIPQSFYFYFIQFSWKKIRQVAKFCHKKNTEIRHLIEK
jgi:hypothetical protein